MIPNLSVREVREALRSHATPGPGEPSTIRLGRIFHETFADLIRNQPAPEVAQASSATKVRRQSLLRNLYQRSVGPRLTREADGLKGCGPEVLAFWSAVDALCEWWASMPDLARVTSAEVPLTATIQAPGWLSPVRLTGVADAVLRLADDRWCVVELKLGKNAPEADLAQALLYHMILSQNGRSPGALALVSFGPERTERLFRADEVESARSALLALIGRLAGVIAGRDSLDAVSPPTVATAPSSEEITEAHRNLGERLVAALREYGAEVRLVATPIVGPAFIRYAIELGKKVKVASVARRAHELQLRLGLSSPPRIGIEGSRVVVDLQRDDRKSVPFSVVREASGGSDDPQAKARVPIGVGLDGSVRHADLTRPEHAHLLVAGTTGSGKSEWLRTALAGLMIANTPETLRLVVIDPKRIAFTWLHDSPFLLRPLVYTPEQSASEVFADLVEEMERRYVLLSQAQCDTLDEYVRKTGDILPRIVCACDEYADLIRGDKEERKRIEAEITRLGAKARAAGIHLILATQQPSRELIKGALDANIPARVGLRTANAIESRMLLNDTGAESLLGQGDLLFKDIGEPTRLQAALLDEDERERLALAAAPLRAATASSSRPTRL